MTEHRLEERYGPIPEAMQKDGVCIICQDREAKEGYLACPTCLENNANL